MFSFGVSLDVPLSELVSRLDELVALHCEERRSTMLSYDKKEKEGTYIEHDQCIQIQATSRVLHSSYLPTQLSFSVFVLTYRMILIGI
jgi:hypothetical protein